MADSMLVAFGRFLRMLRERRGLSLDHVEALTAAYPEPVSKVYLSRVENGHSRIAFSRMIALCRAYDYPIDAASERLWLDLGVDKMEDAPDTSGKGAKELLRAGRDFVRKGYWWHAYTTARDAVVVARSTPFSETFRDNEEQFAICLLNTATASARLGRFRFALTEYLAVEALAALTPKHEALLQERIAFAFRGLGRLEEARVRADRAVELARRVGSEAYLGECLTARALVAYSVGDHELAIALHHDAYRHYKKEGNEYEAANVLINLGQSSFDLGRTQSARRFLAAANRIAERLESGALRVRVHILSGEIEEAKNDPAAAERHWREGQRIAARLGDNVLSFKVKYFLYRNAVRSGKNAIAGKLRNALSRMSPWIPADIAELRAFREELESGLKTRSARPFSSRNDGPQDTETQAPPNP